MNLGVWVTSNNRFRLREFFVSSKYPDYMEGIKILPSQVNVITLGVQSVLDPIAIAMSNSQGNRVPIIITSGFRTVKLNDLIGGANNSDHLSFCAVDIMAPGISSISFRDEILSLLPMLPIRQLIAYKKKPHVHVSWNIPGFKYKREVFTA